MNIKYHYSVTDDGKIVLMKRGIIIGYLLAASIREVRNIILDLNMACEHDWRDGDPWGRGNSDNYVCSECGASVNKSEID